MWLKYADAPITLDTPHREYVQSENLSGYGKPIGFWITDDTNDCWRTWCKGERFNLEGLTHKHEVTLDESGILILRSGHEIEAHTKKYSVPKWWGPTGEPRKYRDICVDWREVAKEYTGLIITPYQWSRRMDAGYSWYYTWDCASGCIWDASAILDVRLIDIDHAITKLQDAEAA